MEVEAGLGREKEEKEMEERHRVRMERTMRRPGHGDTLKKLVTRICVEATEEEMARMIPMDSSSPEEVISWARAEMHSHIPEQRAKWRAIRTLQS